MKKRKTKKQNNNLENVYGILGLIILVLFCFVKQPTATVRVVERFDDNKMLIKSTTDNRVIAYETFPNVLKEIRIHYGFEINNAELLKNDFDINQSNYYEKKSMSPMKIFRIIRLITLGIS